MKWLYFLILLILNTYTYGQIGKDNLAIDNSINNQNFINSDTINNSLSEKRPADSLKIYNPTIGDYNFWTEKYSKRELDTMMTINSFYRQNVYREDLFDKQQFPNLGQALNSLSPTHLSDPLQLLPTGKAAMYMKDEDIRYFDVKTPMTEFVLENGVKEGQFLSTTFAHNIHSRWNYAIQYRYLKSQGRYLNSLANNSNFVFTSNYRTKNNRYQIQGNFVSHDFNNQENGGLTQESLIDFITDNPNFSNRERMYINLQSAQSIYDERRFHLDHKFGIVSFGGNNDTVMTDDYPIYIKHDINYKHQAYQYKEASIENFFPSEIVRNNRSNRKKFDELENKVSIGYQWSDRLQLEGGLLHQMKEIYYDRPLFVNSRLIPASTNDNRLGLQAKLNFDWKENIKLSADGFYTSGDNFGKQYQLNALIQLSPMAGYLLEGGVQLSSSYPSLNYYVNQSFYEDFNYLNHNFSHQNTQKLFAKLSSHKLGLSIFGGAFNQNNPVYINQNYQPEQLEGAINYFNFGAREHINFGKFWLDAQAQYQKVIENDDYLPLPNIIARATIYYDTRAFKDHAHIQTGLTARYYSKFRSREFFPVLNEFKLQTDDTEIGNYPQVDLFFNIKVERMRIYLRGENLNSFFQPGEYFSTPLQPARDFKIQVGIHWFLFS